MSEAAAISPQPSAIVCNCAGIAPTMPTYRAHHLANCPVAQEMEKLILRQRKASKLRRVAISAELLFDLFSPGAHPSGGYSVKDGIPADAELVNVQHGWPNSVELLIRSDDFSPVSMGEEIPHLILTTEVRGASVISVAFPAWAQDIFANPKASAADQKRAYDSAIVTRTDHDPQTDRELKGMESV